MLEHNLSKQWETCHCFKLYKYWIRSHLSVLGCISPKNVGRHERTNIYKHAVQSASAGLRSPFAWRKTSQIAKSVLRNAWSGTYTLLFCLQSWPRNKTGSSFLRFPCRPSSWGSQTLAWRSNFCTRIVAPSTWKLRNKHAPFCEYSQFPNVFYLKKHKTFPWSFSSLLKPSNWS